MNYRSTGTHAPSHVCGKLSWIQKITETCAPFLATRRLIPNGTRNVHHHRRIAPRAGVTLRASLSEKYIPELLPGPFLRTGLRPCALPGGAWRRRFPECGSRRDAAAPDFFHEFESLACRRFPLRGIYFRNCRAE